MFNRKYGKKERGQGLVEYALIIVLIAIVVIVAMQFLSPTIGNVFTNIGNTLSSADGGGSVAAAYTGSDWVETVDGYCASTGKPTGTVVGTIYDPETGTYSAMGEHDDLSGAVTSDELYQSLPCIVD